MHGPIYIASAEIKFQLVITEGRKFWQLSYVNMLREFAGDKSAKIAIDCPRDGEFEC